MTPRIEPLPRQLWDDESAMAIRAGMPAAAADHFLSDAPDAPPLTNAIGSMLHHPQLAAAFLNLSGKLLWEPALPPRLREIVVLRVARRTRSQYEWVQHAKLAQRYDVTAAEIEAIAIGDEAVFSDLEADLLRATDQLLDDYRIDDDVWQRLAAQLDQKTLLEVLFVVGTYTSLAMLLNGIGVELDPDLDPADAPELPKE